jgi:amino acid adenylation domain-containing protein
MEIRQLLTRLKSNGIDIAVNDDKLDINFDGELDAGVLQEIRTHKPAIISFLKKLSGNLNDAVEIPVVEKQDDYVLSSSQHRQWILGQLDGASHAYNEYGVYEFSGDLDIKSFERAFETLVSRHEILRTVFRPNADGEARQLVLSAAACGVKLELLDFTGMPGQKDLADTIIEADVKTGFDLVNGPLVKAKIIKTAESKYVFSYVMHHIISDGWSLKVIVKELLTLYRAYRNGKDNPLLPLRIQYKDYAAWQQQQRTTDAFKGHEQYWVKQFEGELPVLPFFGSRPRPAVKTYNGTQATRLLPASLNTAFKQLIKPEGCTLFMGLMGLVNTLLYKYTAQDEFVVGTVVAGRDHADLEDQIGCYLNTLALRVKLDKNASFRELLRSIRGVTLEAYDHQSYQFDDLLNVLPLQHDLSRSALFDVSVVLQNTQVAGANQRVVGLEDIMVEPYNMAAHSVSKFDLSFNFEETGDDLHALLIYNTDIYDASVAEALLERLERLLVAVLENPAAPLKDLEFLSSDERHRLLSSFNNTQAVYPLHKTVVELFEAQVNAAPANTAFVAGSTQLSYVTLNERANQLANYLRKTFEIQPGDIIAVKLKQSEWMLISILAILKSGAAFLPIDPELPEQRIAFIQQDSGCKLVMDEEALADFKLSRSRYGTQNLPPVNKSSDLAYVIYTSGSTGTPKGVMVEHSSLINLCCWHNDNFEVSSADRATLYAGVSFDASVWETFPYLLAGASLCVVPADIRLDVAAMSHYFEQNKVTISFLPTNIAEQFLETDNTSLRYLLTGGDRLTTTTRKAYQLVNNYGPTEATVVTTSIKIQAAKLNPPIGYPIANFQVYITGSDHELLPVGSIGEICIAGSGLARGYLNKPELTSEKFVPNPFRTHNTLSGERMYKTGDLGRWLPDGSIEFAGRKDDQVKIRGYRIELVEVENALKTNENISAVAVVAKDGAQGEKTLVAYLVGKEPLMAQDMRAHLKDLLPAYMIPEHFVQLPALPLNRHGKVDRKALPDPGGLEVSRKRDYTPARNETDQQLVEIWEEILGRTGISIHDSFYDLGGNSLKATRLVSRINKQFKLETDLKAFFEAPDIAALSDKISNDLWFKRSLVEAEDDNYAEIKI